MKSLKLRNNFYWTGIVDDQLRVFDIIMNTEFGTSYNSYVLKTGGKTILFETAKAKFFDEYIAELSEITELSDIDYLVVNHTEPDHAGSIERLLELCPHLKIISTGTANSFLREIVNKDFTGIIVKDDQTMQIGDKTLRFLMVPNLHWPDTMYTYIEEEQILVTCDSFGSHYGFQDVLLSKVTNWEDYMRATRYYFDCILGPFKPFMLKALDRVRNMNITMICTGHGPVLDEKIDFIMDTYEEWCTVENPNQKKTVVIPYVSSYGYTEKLAFKIAEGIRESGDIETKLYDMVTADQAEVIAELGFADGMLFGTPTILGEALKPIWDLTLAMFPVTHKGKFASAFGSYGWSGEGVPHIIERLKQLRLKVVDDGFRVRFKPSDNQMMDAFEFGYNFGCVMQNRENERKTGRTQLVKCLVCGEIFDASLEICPVCGVGKDKFVPYEKQEIEYRRDSNEFYVILGNGTAGFQAAKAIRERDKTGSVVMISNEPYSAYNRPMLTKSIMADLTESQLAIQDENWYKENRIFQILDKTVTALHTEEKEVELSDGSRMKYTKLIYALGAESFIPSMKGVDQPQVAAIRRLDDTRKLAGMIRTGSRVVVIGGGVLGLEAAWELKKAKCEVTVLELSPKLMARQLDDAAGEMLRAISEKNGVRIHTGVQIEEIEGDGQVTGVRLGSGEVIPADIVVISCGVRANTALAKKAGIVVERGVVVGDDMSTSIADIYACGDCAQYQGINYAIWPEASEQGRVAGANAAGDLEHYVTVPAALTFNGMNTSLFAVGDVGKNTDLIYKTVEFKDMGKKQYEKYYFLNNRLCGVILIGDLTKMAKLSEAINRKAPFHEVL